MLADGVLIRILHAVSSPDQNGDTSVDGTDQSILAGKLSCAFDPIGDFNCSGGLDTGDRAILAAHLGHSCNATVPVRSGSWGLVKTLYR